MNSLGSIVRNYRSFIMKNTTVQVAVVTFNNLYVEAIRLSRWAVPGVIVGKFYLL